MSSSGNYIIQSLGMEDVVIAHVTEA